MRNRVFLDLAPIFLGHDSLNKVVLLVILGLAWAMLPGGSPSYARTHKATHSSHHTEAAHASSHSSHHAEATHASRHSSHQVETAHGSRHKTVASRSTARTSGKHSRGRSVVSYEGSTRTVTTFGRHHGRHRITAAVKHVIHVVHAPRPRYAYPMNFFLLHPPEFDRSPLPEEVSGKIARSFHQGFADNYTARSLVRAGVVSYHPLRGGIFWRREPVKYIIVHSTETGIPLGAQRVIESWSSSGRRHAGAQYVVEREGTIFQAVDPDLGTVHVNVFKTLPGINNDNSIGIEMCHTGRQDYPAAQRESVIKLVAYLQERYKVPDENVITHRYAQQGDHTDPVNFDWEGFLASKNSFRNRAIAYKVRKIKDETKDWTAVTPQTPNNGVREWNNTQPITLPTPSNPDPSTYLQPHTIISQPVAPPATPANPEQAPKQAPYVMMPIVPAPEILPKNMPTLRGPIEMAPQAAPGLNARPAQPPAVPEPE